LKTIPTPIYAARWLWGGTLISPNGEIIRSICDFNLLCSFGGSRFKSHECFGAIATAVVIFREGMVHRVGNGCGVAPSILRHSMTTVGEFPNEVGSMKKEV
jgi:hypothetical protein